MRKIRPILIPFLLILVGYLVYETLTKRHMQRGPLVIKVGYLAHPGYLPLFCADHLGILDGEQILIKLVRFESSPIMMSAFVSNEIQVAPVATVSALSLESLDPGKFKVFALSSETIDNYLTAIVTLSGGGQTIQSIRDLKGKKIGLFPGPAAHALFALVFEKFGLKPGQDVFFQELAPPLQLQALSSGQVAALATYEPIASEAEIELKAKILMPAAVESNVLSPTQGGSWLISSTFLSQHPESVKTIVNVINRGIDFAHQYPDSLPSIIAHYTSVSLQVAQRAHFVTYSKLEQIDTVSYQRHSDLMYDNHIISKRIAVSGFLLDMTKFK